MKTVLLLFVLQSGECYTFMLLGFQHVYRHDSTWLQSVFSFAQIPVWVRIQNSTLLQVTNRKSAFLKFQLGGKLKLCFALGRKLEFQSLHTGIQTYWNSRLPVLPKTRFEQTRIPVYRSPKTRIMFLYLANYILFVKMQEFCWCQVFCD